MIRLLRRFIDGPDDGLPAQLARLKQATADLPTPKRIEGMEWPERDEDHPKCTHVWSDRDRIALELKREREQQQAQPKNVRVFVRGIR